MALQSTDLLIVERSGVQYQLSINSLRRFIGTNYVVADIVGRDALDTSDGLSEGDRVFVVDASSDSTVNSGGAEYIWDGVNWVKVTEIESLDLTGATPTNLNYSASTGVVSNDNGTGFTIPLVNGSTRGLASPTMFNNSHVPASTGATTQTNPININASQEVTLNFAQLNTI